MPTHPYALYEIVGVVALLGLLWVLRTRFNRPGTMFLVTTVGYGIIRFTLSFVRQEAVIVFGLQEAQIVAILTSAIAVAILASRLLLARTPIPAGR